MEAGPGYSHLAIGDHDRFRLDTRMKIRTEFIYPPIPDRHFDWCAVDDDTFEGDGTVGYGATEEEAIADLLEKLES